MARHAPYSYKETKFIPVSFEAQIISGSFEHTLCYLEYLDVHISVFEFDQNQDKAKAVFELRDIANMQGLWLEIVCAIPNGWSATANRGINNLDWFPMD